MVSTKMHADLTTLPGASGPVKESQPQIQITNAKHKVANVKYQESATRFLRTVRSCLRVFHGGDVSALGSEGAEGLDK